MKWILAEGRNLRFFSFAVFYIAQGLPIGLITIALPAWLAEGGASPAAIAGFVAVVSLPWGFKLLAGPIMDRFSFLPMGRRRPWVVGAQFGLFFSMCALGFVPDPVNNILLLTAVAFAVNCFSAVQDVAVDGMAIDVLPIEERGRANAFMGFGQVAGYAGSGALSGTLLVIFGIGGAAWTLAFGVGLIFLLAVIVRERQGERLLPWSEGEASPESLALQAADWTSIIVNLMRVMFLPTSILLILVTLCWRISGGFWITIAPVVAVQDLGYASTQYSQWTGATSFLAACVGVLFGPLIDRIGARYVLMAGMFGMGLLFLLTGFGESFWDLIWIPPLILCLEALFGQAIFISFIALHMNICWARVSATQFAIYMAWANFARSIGAGLYGGVEQQLTASQEFLVMGMVCFVGAGLLLLVKLSAHERRLEELETHFALRGGAPA